jgi:NADH:ubiquinone oxidoreductase subunit K
VRKLSFQVSNIIGKHLFQVAIHINNDGNGYSRFSCGNGYAEQAEEMAIIINVYRNLKQVLTDDITDLKG